MIPSSTGINLLNLPHDYFLPAAWGHILISGSLGPISTEFTCFSSAYESLQVFCLVSKTPAIPGRRRRDPCWMFIQKEVILKHAAYSSTIRVDCRRQQGPVSERFIIKDSFFENLNMNLGFKHSLFVWKN